MEPLKLEHVSNLVFFSGGDSRLQETPTHLILLQENEAGLGEARRLQNTQTPLTR